MNFRLHNMNPGSYSYFRVCNLRSIPVQQSRSQYFSTNKYEYKHRSCSCVHFYEFVYLNKHLQTSGIMTDPPTLKHFQGCNNKLNVNKSEVRRKIFQDIQFKGKDLEQPNYTGCSNYNGANTLQKASQSEEVQRLHRAYTAPCTEHNSV